LKIQSQRLKSEIKDEQKKVYQTVYDEILKEGPMILDYRYQKQDYYQDSVIEVKSSISEHMLSESVKDMLAITNHYETLLKEDPSLADKV